MVEYIYNVYDVLDDVKQMSKNKTDNYKVTVNEGDRIFGKLALEYRTNNVLHIWGVQAECVLSVASSTLWV